MTMYSKHKMSKTRNFSGTKGHLWSDGRTTEGTMDIYRTDGQNLKCALIVMNTEIYS